MKLTAPTIALAVVAASTTAQDTRELGAHEHGHGALNIAVEGARIAMELEAPGFDVVGFEHAAESAEDRAAIEDAVAHLARPGELFLFTGGAACTVTEASVELLEGDHHDGEEHAEDAHSEEHGEKEHAEHAEVEEREAEVRHTEFHATYSVSCDDPGALAAIEFPYFEVFPNAEELEVQLVNDAGASVATVGRDAPSLDLSEMM